MKTLGCFNHVFPLLNAFRNVSNQNFFKEIIENFYLFTHWHIERKLLHKCMNKLTRILELMRFHFDHVLRGFNCDQICRFLFVIPIIEWPVVSVTAHGLRGRQRRHCRRAFETWSAPWDEMTFSYRLEIMNWPLIRNHWETFSWFTTMLNWVESKGVLQQNSLFWMAFLEDFEPRNKGKTYAKRCAIFGKSAK